MRHQLRCVEGEADAAGYTPPEAISNLDDNKPFEQVQSMIQRRVDGIVIVPHLTMANLNGPVSEFFPVDEVEVGNELFY